MASRWRYEYSQGFEAGLAGLPPATMADPHYLRGHLHGCRAAAGVKSPYDREEMDKELAAITAGQEITTEVADA